jgi:hypothetical protein
VGMAALVLVVGLGLTRVVRATERVVESRWHPQPWTSLAGLPAQHTHSSPSPAPSLRGGVPGSGSRIKPHSRHRLQFSHRRTHRARRHRRPR